MNANEEIRLATSTAGIHRGELVERDGVGVSVRRSALMHYVLEKHGEGGLEVLRVRLEGEGETLLVFSAEWAARGYMFAEARGGGWHARAYAPDDMFSLLAGPCADVEWVALDPRSGHRSRVESANMMLRENFLDYLSYSRIPYSLRKGDFETLVTNDR